MAVWRNLRVDEKDAWDMESIRSNSEGRLPGPDGLPPCRAAKYQAKISAMPALFCL